MMADNGTVERKAVKVLITDIQAQAQTVGNSYDKIEQICNAVRHEPLYKFYSMGDKSQDTKFHFF